MNKKEVLEIRKQFTPANCAITRIAGCYVEKYVEYGIPDRPGDARRDTGIFNETKSQ